MRRIAAVFAAKRSDRSDTTSISNDLHDLQHQPNRSPSKVRSRFFRSISRKAPPAPPQVSDQAHLNIDPVPSSSSSSSGVPTTPDDDGGSSLRAATTKKLWNPFPDKDGSTTYPSTPSAHPHPLKPPDHDSDDDSTSDDSEVDHHDASSPHSAPAQNRTASLTPAAYFRALTNNALQPPPSPPPLLHPPNGPLFPRSVNASKSLPASDSLRIQTLRTRLLARLDKPLPFDLRSLAPFAGRPALPPARRPPPPRLDIDTAIKDVQRVRTQSEGLRRWVDRLCFEDRMAVFLPSPDGVIATPVVGPGLGVEAIEFSEVIELLAGLYEPNSAPAELKEQQPRQEARTTTTARTQGPAGEETPDWIPLWAIDTGGSVSLTPPSLTASPGSSVPPSPSLLTPPALTSLSSSVESTKSMSSAATVIPSPLRMEHSASDESPSRPSLPRNAASSPASNSSSSSSSPSNSPSHPPLGARSVSQSAPRPPPSAPAQKHAVHFASTEKEDSDQVPLGYVMRIKKQREEKARFLQAERARRALEDEKRAHEEERRKMEQERATWDRERRARDEEKKLRVYKEEIALARNRRESMRFGVSGVEGAGGGNPVEGEWTGNRERERDRRVKDAAPTYSRPMYDPAASQGPRKQGSEQGINLNVPPSSVSNRAGNESPRPSSLYASMDSQSQPHPRERKGSGSPRPSSVYVPPASSSDVRDRKASGSGSVRGSMVSIEGASQPVRSSGSSMWLSSPNIPPVPSMSMIPMSPPMPMQMSMGMGMGMAMPMGVQMVPVAVPMLSPSANPFMPGLGMDMQPLIPPNPPFVTQQFGYRPPSQNSHRSSSSGNLHQQSQQQQQQQLQPPRPQPRSHSSSPTLERPHRTSATSPSPSARDLGHQRRASGDMDVHRPSAAPRSQSDDRRSSRVPSGSSMPPARPASSYNLRAQHTGGSAPSSNHGHGSASGQRSGSGLATQRPSGQDTLSASSSRTSWAVPTPVQSRNATSNSGFQIVSRPSPGNRRSTMIS